MYTLIVLLSILIPRLSYSASTSTIIYSNVSVTQHISVSVGVTQQMVLPTFDAGAPPPSWVRSSFSGTIGHGSNAIIHLEGPPAGVCFCRTHTDISSYTNGTTTYYLTVDEITGGTQVSAGQNTHTTMPNSGSTPNYMDFTLEGYFSGQTTNATQGTYTGTGSYTITFDGTNCC